MSQLAHQSMDLSEELERIIQEMEWSDVLDSLQVVVDEILGEEPNISSPPPPPPAEQGISIHPQPVEMLQYNNEHVSRLPQVMEENLVPVGTVNGEVVYGIPPDRFAPCASPSFAPPLFAPVSQKRQHEGHQHEGRPYIKKPPKAFMLFRKEQRPKVVAELKLSDSATVNAVLGQRWKLLSKEEQAKYYEEADKERRLHAQLFPDWSSRDNYGKKRKRVRSKAPNRAEASASKPEDVTQRAKKPCVTSVQTATLEPCPSNAVGVDYPHCHSVMTEPSASQTFAVGAPHTQAVVMEAPSPLTVRVKLPPMDTPVTVPVCANCNLPYVNETFFIQSPGTASTVWEPF